MQRILRRSCRYYPRRRGNNSTDQLRNWVYWRRENLTNKKQNTAQLRHELQRDYEVGDTTCRSIESFPAAYVRSQTSPSRSLRSPGAALRPSSVRARGRLPCRVRTKQADAEGTKHILPRNRLKNLFL